jgi:hypothetical protein
MAMMGSPERATYPNDGHCPSDKKNNTINSPERAIYKSEAVSLLAIKTKAL